MRLTLSLLSFFAVLAATLAGAQPAVTAEDYVRAESFLSGQTDPLVSGVMTSPAWLSNDQLAYQNQTPEGREFVIADPAGGTRVDAFDHARMAAALSVAANTNYNAFDLPA